MIDPFSHLPMLLGITPVLVDEGNTDKMAKMIFQIVIIPKAIYPLTGLCPKEAEIAAIEQPFRTLLKHKAGLPQSISNSLLFSEVGPGIMLLRDALFGKDLSDFPVWLNTPTIVGAVTQSQFRKIQEKYISRLHSFSLASNTSLHTTCCLSLW